MANNKLTPEERATKIAQKKERLKLQLAKVTSLEKKTERKERARELIEIGAIISQHHDRKKLLEYLKNPRLGCWDIDGGTWNLGANKEFKIGEEVGNDSKKSKIKRIYIDLKHVPE